YLMLNTGAFVAPLVTGVLAQDYGWQYGFGFAGVGMLVGVIVYLSGRRIAPPDEVRTATRERTRLAASEWRVVYVLILMLPVLALFWVAQAQIWNTYNLWARDHLNLVIAGWRMPVPWLSAIDSLAVIVMAPPILLLWRAQARRVREPDELRKLGIG